MRCSAAWTASAGVFPESSSSVTRKAATSESVSVAKRWPLAASSSRSARKFSMMPLWTTARRSLACGWALFSVGLPCVAQRVWPMPIVAAERRSASLASRLRSLPSRAHAAQLAVLQRRDAGGIIAAIFEPLQRLDDPRRRRALAQNADNPAHDDPRKIRDMGETLNGPDRRKRANRAPCAQTSLNPFRPEHFGVGVAALPADVRASGCAILEQSAASLAGRRRLNSADHGAPAASSRHQSHPRRDAAARRRGACGLARRAHRARRPQRLRQVDAAAHRRRRDRARYRRALRAAGPQRSPISNRRRISPASPPRSTSSPPASTRLRPIAPARCSTKPGSTPSADPRHFSGGEARRAAIAKALAREPEAAAARRADQSSRHRRHRMAGAAARGLARRLRADQPRPAAARATSPRRPSGSTVG